MPKNIDPQLKLISGYLKLEKTANFVVPNYQRPYSWDITQCDKLWQDIEAFIESGGSDPYFFGTIIVDCSKEDDKHCLIDGQQRTITFLLMLKALLIRLNEVIAKLPNDEDTEPLKEGLSGSRRKIMSILYKAEDDYIPAMLKDSSKIKGILILENNSINETYKDEIKTIIEAKDFDDAELNVTKFPRRKNDNKYTRHFRNFKFFYNKLVEKYDSPSLNQFAKVFLDKCQVIEIRSWQLEQAITMFNSLNSTGMPLSDADIISAQLYSNAKDKEEFNKKWENIIELANKLQTQNVTDTNAILTQFMYISRAYHKEYLNLKNNSVDVTVPGLRRYYTDLRKEILGDPIDLCNELLRIAKTWELVMTYPVVKLLLKFNDNAKLYLSAFLYRFETENITENSVVDIVECLIRLFTILELVDAGYSSKNFKTFLFEVNLKLVDKKILFSEIIQDFNNHISKCWKEENIITPILEYEKNILVFLNEYLYAKNKNKKFDFTANVNVEHIMPVSGRYTQFIKQDANITDDAEFDNYVNKLGNKILLEEDINRSISNEWFKAKKQNLITDKLGYKDSKYAIAEALTKYPKDTWNKDDITKATEKVADRITRFIFKG